MNDPKTEAPLVDDLLDGVQAIATFTGFSRRRCFYLLERELLPAGKLGTRWIASRAAVRRALTQIATGQVAGDEAA